MGGDTACLSGRAAGRLEADIWVQEIEENHSNRGIERVLCLCAYARSDVSGCGVEPIGYAGRRIGKGGRWKSNFMKGAKTLVLSDREAER